MALNRLNSLVSNRAKNKTRRRRHRHSGKRKRNIYNGGKLCVTLCLVQLKLAYCPRGLTSNKGVGIDIMAVMNILPRWANTKKRTKESSWYSHVRSRSLSRRRFVVYSYRKKKAKRKADVSNGTCRKRKTCRGTAWSAKGQDKRRSREKDPSSEN